MKVLSRIVIIIILLAITVNFAYRIDLKRTRHELIGELAYFPSGLMVRTMAMGFHAVLADAIWLRFIQYYGEHRLTDVKFELMYQILDILTTLDHRYVYAYTLGSLMLTHDAQRPDQGLKLLKKGMYANPDEWRYPFMYAFINFVFVNDIPASIAYFRVASYKPTSTDMPKRWLGYLLKAKKHDLKSSLAIWIDLYNNTKNPEERLTAQEYIGKIHIAMAIEYMNQGMERYIAKNGRYPRVVSELVSSGCLDSIPAEPFGERWVIRNGRILSTWMREYKYLQSDEGN